MKIPSKIFNTPKRYFSPPQESFAITFDTFDHEEFIDDEEYDNISYQSSITDY